MMRGDEKPVVPASGGEAGTESQSNGRDRSADYAPSEGGTKGDIVTDLSDIPAIREYLNRVGARTRSMFSAVVAEQAGGYRRDLVTIRLNKVDGVITVTGEAEGYEPTDREAADIVAAVVGGGLKWPEPIRLHRLINLPPAIENAESEDIFEFRDRDDQIIMVQVRIANDDGGKEYRPYTYFDDEVWRCMEPEGLLPLWGLPQLKGNTTVFIHEGAKAARAMQRLIQGGREQEALLAEHPWGQQLDGAAHLGWIGGALSPHRTDWSVLKAAGVTRVYIVNDNDDVGREAVPKISRALKGYDIVVTNICVIGDKFPVGWDLADAMPTDAHGEYTGEPMMSYAVPATWLTRTVQTGNKGRPAYELRPVATELIVPIRDQECFGYAHNGMVRQASQLNKAQAPFSDVDDSARLFWRNYTHGSVDGLTYCPAEKARIIQEGDRRNFNTYTPSPVQGEKGDLAEWKEYLAYMFPVAKDRLELERWCATLIGRPDVRMTYSLLLISTRQGKGKSTLLDAVLRPLVGMSNSALVKSNDLKSGFNGWAAAKRLAICHEIYEGRNKALAESLKSVVTDARISINEKYEKPYELPNWIVIAACSNSRRAVNIDNKDRRWFIPSIDESEVWSGDRFTQFRDWLRCHGLRAIKYWAEKYESEYGGQYVRTGQHAPMSDAKLVSIEENLSDGARFVLDMAEAVAGFETYGAAASPAAVGYHDLYAAARNAMKGCQDTDAELLAVAEGAGLSKFVASDGGDRLKVAGRPRRYLLNEAARRALAECSDGPESERKKVREWAQVWRTWWNEQGVEIR